MRPKRRFFVVDLLFPGPSMNLISSRKLQETISVDDLLLAIRQQLEIHFGETILGKAQVRVLHGTNYINLNSSSPHSTSSFSTGGSSSSATSIGDGKLFLVQCATSAFENVCFSIGLMRHIQVGIGAIGRSGAASAKSINRSTVNKGIKSSTMTDNILSDDDDSMEVDVDDVAFDEKIGDSVLSLKKVDHTFDSNIINGAAGPTSQNPFVSCLPQVRGTSGVLRHCLDSYCEMYKQATSLALQLGHADPLRPSTNSSSSNRINEDIKRFQNWEAAMRREVEGLVGG